MAGSHIQTRRWRLSRTLLSVSYATDFRSAWNGACEGAADLLARRPRWRVVRNPVVCRGLLSIESSSKDPRNDVTLVAQPKTVKTPEPRIVLSLCNREELLEFARRAVVPLHIEGRKNIDREMWVLSRYLLALTKPHRIEIPMTVSHALPGESPDFVIEFDGKTVGLEVTEATTK